MGVKRDRERCYIPEELRENVIWTIKQIQRLYAIPHKEMAALCGYTTHSGYANMIAKGRSMTVIQFRALMNIAHEILGNRYYPNWVVEHVNNLRNEVDYLETQFHQWQMEEVLTNEF